VAPISPIHVKIFLSPEAGASDADAAAAAADDEYAQMQQPGNDIIVAGSAIRQPSH
jgi:hypothetical protein